jgi:hypothetical protein
MNNLSEEDVSRSITDFETKHDLFSIQVDGISPWQLIRHVIIQKFQKLPYSKPRLSNWDIFFACVKGLQFWKLISAVGCNYVAFGPCSSYRQRVDDKFRDVLLDDILEAIPRGQKMVTLNGTGFAKNIKNAFFPPYDVTLFSYVASILARIFPYRHGGNEFLVVSKFANQFLGVNSFSAAYIKRLYGKIYWQTILYQRLIHFLKPRFCFDSSVANYALINACKKEKVVYVLLQHGVLTKHSRFIVSAQFESCNLLLPDFIAVYGKYWEAELLESYFGIKKRVVSIGSGVIDQHLENKNLKKRTKTILLTSQGVDSDNLINFISKFLALSNSKFEFVFRLHPTYDLPLHFYENVFKNDRRVRVCDGSGGETLYELLSRSDLHMSIYSACHFDAISLGVPSVVLKLEGYKTMSNLIDSGVVLLVETPKDLADLVSCDDLNHKLDPASMEYFCKRGFKKNILDFYNSL